MGHLFLIGFMGCGKTTVSKALERVTKRPLIDTDERIMALEKRTINEIFKKSGEGYFRRLEHMVLAQLQGEADAIISCGGGMAMRDENIKLMKDIGCVLYLRASAETILSRVKHTHHRPLLEGKKNLSDITAMMESRVPFYERAADYIVCVDNKNPENIVSEIINQSII